LAAVPARSDEPKLPASATAPIVALASATEADGKVTIRLRVLDSVPTMESKTITTVQKVTALVDGKPVIKEVPVQTRMSVVVMKPKRWREVKLSAATPGVEVRDLAGKLVPAQKLPALLEKEKAILLSTNGPVDPFHLQLTKEGTLVVLAPPGTALGMPTAVSPSSPLTPPSPGVAAPPLPPPPPKKSPKE
jgi:hypothetical protein